MLDDEYNSQLQAAIRRRLLEEIEGRRGGGPSPVVNNVYGGGVGGGGGGLREQMAGGDDMDPAARDYFVDILREDLDINPDTDKPRGWRKKVHRFTTPHNEDAPKKKDFRPAY